jgi:hypothetical protein
MMALRVPEFRMLERRQQAWLAQAVSGSRPCWVEMAPAPKNGLGFGTSRQSCLGLAAADACLVVREASGKWNLDTEYLSGLGYSVLRT